MPFGFQCCGCDVVHTVAFPEAMETSNWAAHFVDERYTVLAVLERAVVMGWRILRQYSPRSSYMAYLQYIGHCSKDGGWVRAVTAAAQAVLGQSWPQPRSRRQCRGRDCLYRSCCGRCCLL